ncbi:MAG TPA: serine/threonine-protein kinase [Polyangiaceae bacterium LLY-WYZ-15_(1-7)]|nr:serine/threonine-protein kinase [Polyangiaceae bacterium LLY-WYZ-15_(1-7)]HJL08121.1 serine/threonine-protein kinase [Polyangiaceae bacterium LLY-WYZ-15_(1-7)]HJL49101.1 serine/threonine-protein kinase [Polyangiaceae bacterium LLY-WYZ-15_(1-7)]
MVGEAPISNPWETEEETAVMAPFSAGSFFGDRFRIDAALGAGGMGAVYRATDLRTEQPVALKVLLKRKHEEEARQRFAREAEILSKISHPGIVGIRGYGHAPGGVPWLAMELVEGETLGERIRRKGALEPEAFGPVLTAVCDALEAAHRAGVIHRDLKPDHVMLHRRDDAAVSVKLIDFGLSRAEDLKKLTATGTVIGTPRYMAPEQIASAANTGPRSDVYALGVIVYEALTGESPFAASDHGQLLGAILQGRIEPASARRPELPAELDAFFQRALAKDPAQRFQTPRELNDAFLAAVGLERGDSPRFSIPPDGLYTPAGSFPSPAPPLERVAREEPRRFWAIVLGLGLVTAAIAGAVSFLLLR